MVTVLDYVTIAQQQISYSGFARLTRDKETKLSLLLHVSLMRAHVLWKSMIEAYSLLALTCIELSSWELHTSGLPCPILVNHVRKSETRNGSCFSQHGPAPQV